MMTGIIASALHHGFQHPSDANFNCSEGHWARGGDFPGRARLILLLPVLSRPWVSHYNTYRIHVLLTTNQALLCLKSSCSKRGADVLPLYQNEHEIKNFRRGRGWYTMRPLKNWCFWQVWTRAQPKRADGEKTADVKVVSFVHMFFHFTIISTLYFNCQGLKNCEKHSVRNLWSYFMPDIKEGGTKGENKCIDFDLESCSRWKM